MVLRTVSGKNNQCLATAYLYIGEYCLVVDTHSQTKEGSGMRIRFIEHGLG